jgi:hypothetical protein
MWFSLHIAGKFRQYDYGSKEENMKMYNSTEPPDYNLHKVTSPVYIQYALGDMIALPKVLCTKF